MKKTEAEDRIQQTHTGTETETGENVWKKNKISCFLKVFRGFIQCFGSDYSFLSTSVKLDGDYQWTIILRALHRFSLRFKSKLWLNHSVIFRGLCWSHSSVGWALCFGSFAPVFAPSLPLCALWSSFFARTSVSVSVSLGPDYSLFSCCWEASP